jgi:type IV pilus assembly protein PilA
MMTRSLQRGATFVQNLFWLLILFLFGQLYGMWYASEHPCNSGYTICARTSELILAASPAKSALSLGYRAHGSFSPNWMSAITVAPSPLVAGSAISPNGEIRVTGTAVASMAIITMTPHVTTENKLVWTCKGQPAKYMPASCR